MIEVQSVLFDLVIWHEIFRSLEAVCMVSAAICIRETEDAAAEGACSRALTTL